MALESMCTAFLKKFIPDFVEDRRMTLTDIAERSMKKGKAAEQVTGKMTTIFNIFDRELAPVLGTSPCC